MTDPRVQALCEEFGIEIIPAHRYPEIGQTRAVKTILRMAGWFGRDHTTILFALASHAEKTGAPRLTTYNLALTRRRNAANQSSARKRARQNGGQN